MDRNWVDDVHAAIVERGSSEACLLVGIADHELHGLPGAEQIDEVLALRALNPATVRMVRGGAPVPAQAYLRHQKGYQVVTAVDPAAVGELMRTGATLSVNDLHHIEPRSAAIVAAVEEAFGTSAEAVLFVTPAGNAGFRPHADASDVVVLQTVGTKDWRVWARPGGSVANREHDVAELGCPALEVTLEPGDVLYLPAGTPHAASATQELSMHLSFGLAAEPRLGWIRAEFSDLLADAVTTPMATRLAALESEMVAAVRPAPSTLGRVVGSLAGLARADVLTGHSVVRTRVGVLEVVERTSGATSRVKANGVTMDVPLDVVELLLSDRASTGGFCANDLPVPTGGLPTKVRLLKQLHRVGIVE